jgi:pilus assembly protein Flp/PilA
LNKSIVGIRGVVDAKGVRRRYMLVTYMWLRARLARQEGQALVEYALILSLIAVVVVTVLTLLGGNVSKILSQINSAI